MARLLLLLLFVVGMAPSYSETYQYDVLGRLAHVDYGDNLVTYHLDSVGNRVLESGPPPLQHGFDIDGNGSVDALTDGILIIRYLSGFTGEALVSGATASPSASAEQIAAYLAIFTPGLDVDGNQSVEALTDGILIMRHMLGFTGSALTSDAIAPNATRTTAAEIEAWFQAFAVDRGLDINFDGLIDASNDGILILRYLAGLRNDSILLKNAITPESRVRNGDSIRSYIQALVDVGALDVNGDGVTDASNDGILILRYLAGLRNDSILLKNAITTGSTRVTGNEIRAWIRAWMKDSEL